MKGTIQEHGKNSWRLKWELPRSAAGRRQQGSKVVHGTKRDAQAQLRRVLSALDKGEYVTPANTLLANFLDRWLSSYAATNTGLRTQQGYRGIIKRYLVPVLGSIPLASLKPEHVQELYAEMLGRGLSSRTVLHTHRLLKEALRYAVRWRLVDRNVCDLVDPPRPSNSELRSLDADGVKRFMEAYQETQFPALFYCLMFTGIRRSEILALRWENLDLECSKISVTASWQRIIGRGLMLLPTKTKRSRRSISISEEVVDVLRQVRGEQLVNQAELGPVWINSGFVFVDEIGNPLDPDRVTREFQRFRDRAALGNFTLRELRHTHATLMLKAGVPIKVVLERLGHASTIITMDIYSHVLPDMQEDAVERFIKLVEHASQ